MPKRLRAVGFVLARLDTQVQEGVPEQTITPILEYFG